MSSSVNLTFLPSPGMNAPLEKMWAYIVHATQRIISHPEITLSPKEQSDLYTTVYNYCTSSKHSLGSSSPSNRGGANLVGGEIYNLLKDHLTNRVNLVAESSLGVEDEELLSMYATEWQRYKASFHALNRGFSTINRYWVRHQRVEGRWGVYPIEALATLLWRDHVFSVIQRRDVNGGLSQPAIHLITKHRNGEQVNLDLVKVAVDSFVPLGIDADNFSTLNLRVYEEEFQADFLIATRAYYTNEYNRLVSQIANVTDVAAYSDRVAQRLREEASLASEYRHPSTRAELISTCKEVLLRTYVDSIADNVPALFVIDDRAALQRTYSFLSCMPEGLRPLRERFVSRVQEDGLNFLQQLVQVPPASSSTHFSPPSIGPDPTTYANALLHIQIKYTDLIVQCFNNDGNLLSDLKKVFTTIVNQNPAIGFDASKSAEAVGRYVGGLIDSPGVQADAQTFKSALHLRECLEEQGVFMEAAGVN